MRSTSGILQDVINDPVELSQYGTMPVRHVKEGSMPAV